MGAYYGLGLGLGGAPVPIRGSHLAVGGLIEQYPGAAAAYSLRALRNNTGNVVRVRRSSDDTEQDFTAAQVSDGALVDFANNGTSDLYGERMYFDGDGSNDDVSLDNDIVLSGDFDISFNVISFGSAHFLSNTSGSGRFGFNAGFLFASNDSDTAGNISSSGFQEGVDQVVRFSRSGTTLTAYVNGVSQGTASLSGTITINNIASKRGTATGVSALKGVIYDIEIDVGDTGTNDHEYQGYGNTNADWEDQIGSNDGTVNGSPALYSGQGFDGFVTTWYGQVPGVNSSNSTSTSQPKIVNNGSLITGNSVGMPLWDGSNDTLRVLASEMPTPTTAFQISVVCKNNKSALSGNEYIFGQYESTTNNRSFALIYRPTSRIGVNFGNPSTGAFGGSWSSDGVTLIGELLAVGVTYNAGTVKIYVNGSEVSSSIDTGSIPTSLFNTSSDYTIGSALSSDSPVAVFDGQIGEIYFAKNLTDDIVKIQQNQMEGWGITP